jgi:hypothetical protein
MCTYSLPVNQLIRDFALALAQLQPATSIINKASSHFENSQHSTSVPCIKYSAVLSASLLAKS